MKYEIREDNFTRAEPFSIDLIAHPPASYWPFYSWWWNDQITAEGIREQIGQFIQKGIKNIYIIATPADYRPNQRPTPLQPDYGTPDYFALYQFAVAWARDQGMQFWFYDEPGFPSGSADGRVVKHNPEVEKKGLIRTERMLHSGETYQTPEDVIGAFLLDTWPVRGVYEAGEEILVVEYRTAIERKYPMPYPDLLDSRATEILLDILFDEYKKHIGHYFGSTIPMVFLDEPAASRHPWTDGFTEQFRQRYGYSIADYLPAIMNPYLQGEKGKQARIDYYDFNSALFCKHYFDRIRSWCRDQGLLLCGHLGGEDDTHGCIDHGYFHLLRLLRSFDVPGVDAIWRQIFPGRPRLEQSNLGRLTTAQNHFFPRYGSSAASQTGSLRSLTESGAVYGGGLTFSQLRFVTLFQMVRGINVVNYMSLHYSSRGYLAAAMRPNFLAEPPHDRDLLAFNEMMARLSYLMTSGPICVDVALYMPMRDFWVDDSLSVRTESLYEAIAVCLEQHQCYYDLIDDDVLETATGLHTGQVKTGLAIYSQLIIPACRFLPPASREALERFIRGGGQVFIVHEPGSLPESTGSAVDQARIISIEQVPALINPVVDIQPHNKEIRAIKRSMPDGSTLYLVTNEQESKTQQRVFFSETAPAYEVDLLSGRLSSLQLQRAGSQSCLDIALDSGEGRVFLFSKQSLVSSRSERIDPEQLTCLQTLTSFTFRRLRRLCISTAGLESISLNETDQTVPLGDWRSFAGFDFSGDALYSACFARPADGEAICLDLGEVRYTCEVLLNGASLGVRIMAPYVYYVPPELLCEINQLEIRVTNTAANEYVAKSNWLTETYTIKKLGSYHVLNTVFEQESLSGGLFGPVRICTDRSY